MASAIVILDCQDEIFHCPICFEKGYKFVGMYSADHFEHLTTLTVVECNSCQVKYGELHIFNGHGFVEFVRVREITNEWKKIL